ncbi:unnamed protein product [Symbiodinium microadriaticum]|nr:unnamed protein product [Symbiodinium microadriaticum]
MPRTRGLLLSVEEALRSLFAALHAGGAPRRSRARAGGEAHDMRQEPPPFGVSASRRTSARPVVPPAPPSLLGKHGSPSALEVELHCMAQERADSEKCLGGERRT